MKKCTGLVTTVVGVVLATSAMAEDSLTAALKDGEAHLSFRYRAEQVDQAGFGDNALASTLRTRLNYVTGNWQGFSGLVEFDNLSTLGQDNYNSTRNGKTSYPVVADPTGTGVNQLFVKYATGDDSVVVGRQRVNLDNQRFVGGVGWRQNEQTYDAATFSYSATPDTKLMYSYVNRVSRVFGPDAGTPAPTLDTSAHLLHVDQMLGAYGHVTGYAYLLDVENAAAASSRTIGVRYANTWKSRALELPLVVEYARQGDYGDNPVSYSANYWLIEAGFNLERMQFTVGDEVLDADAGKLVGFATPLATLHKFQGWADQFLSTPGAGVDDRYVGAKGSVQGIGLSLTFHDFQSAVGSTDYGTEWDVSASKKFGKHVDVLLKYANYSADAFSVDTRKLWLMVSTSF